MRVIFLFILFSVAVKAASDGTSPSELKVRRLVADSITSDLSIIGSDSNTVLPLLRDIATGKINHIGGASVSQDNAQIVLIRLGDDQTIQQVVAQYQQYDSRYSLAHIPDMFEWSNQPQIITYLASDFYLNEDATKSINQKEDPGFAVTAPVRSIYSAVISLEIIKRSPEFRPDMKAWAKDAYALRFKDPAKFRHLMQAWWQENKDAFRQKNYSAVQPLDINSFEAATAPTPPPPSPPEVKPVPKPPEPVAQVTPPAPMPEVQAAPETRIAWWIYVTVVLSLGLIGSLWYFLKTKK